MAKPKRLKFLMGLLKDKAALLKAALLLSGRTAASRHHLALLHATSHDPSTSPPPSLLDAIASLGPDCSTTAAAAVDAVTCRLRRTHNPHVALKCLLTLHHILSKGATFLHPQFSGGRNFLNLTGFRAGSGEAELAAWVRWYAGVIEHLGFFYSSVNRTDQKQRISRVSDSNLLQELKFLVEMVEKISGSPDSLHLQRINSIYEAMKLVGEDYRMTQRQISARLCEIRVRMDELSDENLGELQINLKKLEDCKEKIFLMFLNKKRNDGIWDLISGLKREVEVLKERRESLRLVVRFGLGGEVRSDSARLGPEDTAALVRVPCGRKWLDVDWNKLTVATAS